MSFGKPACIPHPISFLVPWEERCERATSIARGINQHPFVEKSFSTQVLIDIVEPCNFTDSLPRFARITVVYGSVFPEDASARRAEATLIQVDKMREAAGAAQDCIDALKHDLDLWREIANRSIAENHVLESNLRNTERRSAAMEGSRNFFLERCREQKEEIKLLSEQITNLSTPSFFRWLRSFLPF